MQTRASTVQSLVIPSSSSSSSLIFLTITSSKEIKILVFIFRLFLRSLNKWREGNLLQCFDLACTLRIRCGDHQSSRTSNCIGYLFSEQFINLWVKFCCGICVFGSAYLSPSIYIFYSLFMYGWLVNYIQNVYFVVIRSPKELVHLIISALLLFFFRKEFLMQIFDR